VYRAGPADARGRRSVEVSVCPSRLMAEAPWALEFVEWWLWSVRWDGMSGSPSGAPRWPFKGGLKHQPRRLFEACKLLRAEWPSVARPQPEQKED
jgi:hypothetical protein